MTPEDYYGEALPRLKQMEKTLLEMVGRYPSPKTVEGVQPILYCSSRIKSPESMMGKLRERGLPTDAGTALAEMHDAVGLRVVCSFMEDVYAVADWLAAQENLEILGKKDYIAYPKPNGYRSLHLIVGMAGLMAEVQLRTIAIDSWAALEHQLKYKRQIAHEKTIHQELKRCADEIASVDMSMQTLRDILRDGEWT